MAITGVTGGATGAITRVTSTGRVRGSMDAVCFDMDGVLVNSEDYWIPRENEDLLPRLAPESGARAAEITGMNYHEVYGYFEREYGVAMSKEEFLEWYEATAEEIYGEEVDLLAGAQELVDELRDRGVAVAIVSSSPLHWIETVVERFDLDVDTVLSAGEIDGPGKPEPEIYGHAVDSLGVDPGDAVAVEDSTHGIESADRAGLYVVAFRHGEGDRVDRSRADYVAGSPADLREHLLTRARQQR